MFLEVMGIYYKNPVFWSLSIVGYTIVIIIMTFSIYFTGAKPDWKLNAVTILRAFKIIFKLMAKGDSHIWRENFAVNRLILIVLLSLANVGFIIFGAVSPGTSKNNNLIWIIRNEKLINSIDNVLDFSSLLLYIFILSVGVFANPSSRVSNIIKLKTEIFMPMYIIQDLATIVDYPFSIAICKLAMMH